MHYSFTVFELYGKSRFVSLIARLIVLCVTSYTLFVVCYISLLVPPENPFIGTCIETFTL